MNAESGMITNLVVTPGNAYDRHKLPEFVNRDLELGLPIDIVAADRGYDDGNNHYFSQKTNPDLITRYIRGMPQIKGAIIFDALTDAITVRIKHRAKVGRVNAWHRPIVDTPLLEEWVDTAYEVIQYTRTSLEGKGVPVIELDAEKQPIILAQRDIELILDDKTCRN